MKPKVILIVGPTASGKTAVSIDLARAINGEIISCDSMQVYEGMPIVSQIPAQKDLNRARHHNISCVPPEDEFDTAKFVRTAGQLIRDIIKREKAPILAGGTGLYAKALVDGLFPSPKKDIAFRRELERLRGLHGPGYLHGRLRSVDAESAKKIHPNDTRRIIRALEILHLTKATKTQSMERTKGLKDKYEFIKCAIALPRAELYERINIRVDAMFRRGLVKEVKGLLKRDLSLTAGSALGIREVRGYLEGAYGIEEAKELLKKNTRRYAKRQLTWFRQDKQIRWFNEGKGIIDHCQSILEG